MRLIIAGSRSITDPQIVKECLLCSGFYFKRISAIICGGARGVDTLGELFAKDNNIPVEYYPADWDKYGKRAGYIRNKEMADNADALLAIWDGKSKGTGNMILIAHQKGLTVYVKVVDNVS